MLFIETLEVPFWHWLKTLNKFLRLFPLLPLVFLISQDSAEDVEEAGALPKLPVFGASGAEGFARELEKECPPVESALLEVESREPEKATGTEPASATEGNDAEVTSENESSHSTALGESTLELGKTEAAPSETSAQEPKKITYSQIVREGRRFNIDLVSKVGTEGLSSYDYIYFA